MPRTKAATKAPAKARVPKKAPATKVYTESQLYTGRAVTVKRSTGNVTGKVSNGGQCSDSQFAFSGPGGEEDCVARSAIVSLGT